MPNCQNCGSFVTETYVRVLEPEDIDEPRCCPDCDDLTRRNGKIVETFGASTNHQDPVEYDPEYAD